MTQLVVPAEKIQATSVAEKAKSKMETREQVLLATEKRKLLAEALRLSENPNATKADLKRADVLLAQAANLRSRDELAVRAASVAEEMGVRVDLVRETEEERQTRAGNIEIRNYLANGREARTYSGLSVATDSAGGYFVPQGYFRDKVFSMLKAYDRLFDPKVVTVYDSENGNTLTVPMLNDTGVSAAVVSENAQSTEGEITAVGQLQLAKVPTWRSKQIVWSMELLQDSAFPAEDLIASAVALRFSRGIGASNVTTMLSAATSGATSAAAGAVTGDDLYALMDSVDPAYLASPKCYWTMSFATLISILKLKDSSNRYLFHPRTDADGNVLLLEKPVAICPSMPAIAASATSVALGDFSRLFVRVVKNSLKLQKYSQAPNLAEYGLFAFESFVRSNAGLLVVSGADSPIKYLTQASS
jgi:HK97 family phage major capsid protein